MTFHNEDYSIYHLIQGKDHGNEGRIQMCMYYSVFCSMLCTVMDIMQNIYIYIFLAILKDRKSSLCNSDSVTV